MKLGRTILLGAVFAIYFGAPATSATIRSLAGKDGRAVIQISGRIETGDADVFMGVLKEATAAGHAVETVQLNSPGGQLGEGAKLAVVIKFGKISTFVGSGSVCASACFLLFAAGHSKFVGPGALIGVHKASDRGGRETARSGEATHSMARFARELGVPSWIVDRMLVTSPTQIAWLDAQDLRVMGVTITGKSVQVLAAEKEDSSGGEQPATSELAALPIPPTSAIPARPSWNEFIDQTIALSAQQNQGQAALSRFCKPESRECIMQVAYLLKDGRKGLATAVQDGNGNITRREVCETNVSGDVRECTDWDTGAKYRDLKNTNGNWVQTLQ